MPLEHWIAFIVLALVAEILGTLGGFGSSLFFVPIAAYFLDFHAVLGVTAFFHVFSNFFKIAFFRKGIDRKLVIQIGIPATLFVVLGAYLSQFVTSSLLEIILAVFLISLSIFFLVYPAQTFKPNTYSTVGAGVFSGMAAGLVGTGGAIRGMALSAFALSKDVFIATSAFIDMGVDIGRSAMYFFQGYMKLEHVWLMVALFFTSFFGTYIGRWLLKFYSEKQFRTTVLLLILAIGVYTLIKQLILEQ